MTTLARETLLACPTCHGELAWRGVETSCARCEAVYGVDEGVPVLFPLTDEGAAEEVYDAAPPGMLDRLPASVRGVAQRVRRALQPSLVFQSAAGRARIGEFVASRGPEARIVNIGCGRTDYGANVLNLDVFPAPTVDALATSEQLPLRSGAFEGVILEAVLEHVRDADATLLEIRRVLVPGGRAFIDVPFLQPYHPSPGDYRRYTEQGLRTRLEQLGFTVTSTGVSVGPASAFAWIGSHFLAMLLSGRSRRAYRLARVATDLLFVPVKYADAWLDRHPDATLIASGVWAVAELPEDPPH